jgi:hypothetical protein
MQPFAAEVEDRVKGDTKAFSLPIVLGAVVIGKKDSLVSVMLVRLTRVLNTTNDKGAAT